MYVKCKYVLMSHRICAVVKKKYRELLYYHHCRHFFFIYLKLDQNRDIWSAYQTPKPACSCLCTDTISLLRRQDYWSSR